MLDPYITPCCDQKQLRYFFEKVNSAGFASFFTEPDYPMSQFLEWIVYCFPASEITIASPTINGNTLHAVQQLMKSNYYAGKEIGNVPIISHLNIITGKDQTIPDSILDNPLVTVAQDTFTYNYILIHRTYGKGLENANVEQDTEKMSANLDALSAKAAALRAMVADGKTTRLAYEELESAWIDYLLSSTLTTSSIGTYYTMHGIVQQVRRSVHEANSVTCIKGKYAYDDVMRTLSAVLRTKKVKR